MTDDDNDVDQSPDLEPDFTELIGSQIEIRIGDAARRRVVVAGATKDTLIVGRGAEIDRSFINHIRRLPESE